MESYNNMYIAHSLNQHFLFEYKLEYVWNATGRMLNIAYTYGCCIFSNKIENLQVYEGVLSICQ